MNDQQSASSKPSECERERIAENSVGSIEVCNCGMWRLNVGAVTLRFDARALWALHDLLSEAASRHTTRSLGSDRDDYPLLATTPRGSA